jgi:hypothetical protein
VLSKKLAAAVALAVFFAIVGSILISRGPRYYLVAANRTHHRLTNIWVYYDTTIAAAPGDLVPGGLSSYGPIGLPIPQEAIVNWTDANGVHHSPRVRLAGNVPRRPRSQQIWLIIEEDETVTVRMLPIHDVEANAALVRAMLLPYRQKDLK